MEEYIKKFDYQFYTFLNGYLMPIIIWYILVYIFLYNKVFTNLISIEMLILLLPLLPIVLNIYILYGSNSANIDSYFKGCVTTKITQEQRDIGIVGLFNNKCLNQHFYLSQEMIKDLTNRFYALGYTLLLFMLVVQNTFVKKDDKLQTLIILSFFLSIVGSCITQWFQWEYYITLISQHVASTILSFNISMVLFVVYYLFNKFKTK